MALDSDLADLPDALFTILQAYASLSHPKNLPDLLHYSFTDVHDFLLNWLLLHPHFRVYQPSGRYQVLFWKWAIQRLETLIQGQDAEINDRIYTHLVDMVQGVCPDPSSGVIGTMPPEESYVTYLWRSPDVRSASICAGIASATLLESRMLTERGTTGLTTWIASISLAEFLIKHPDVVQQQRVLELGSGAGFLGIVVATLQQQQYNQSADSTGDRSELWLTDVHPLVVERCRNNIRLPCSASVAAQTRS
ncbi:hypothetical protein DAEQUDRAFT_662533 [Daedalea quercina L-15889]|uniref:Uncharacterized protein n=1 Tax=Daedalea quercina L-15889 TaxID=1314783 RepID=A0A165TC97_9APHY|nr:hypothetical protein DAEQUDRAFT_662533 [Daedalea quercina L-15889]